MREKIKLQMEKKWASETHKLRESYKMAARQRDPSAEGNTPSAEISAQSKRQ